MVEALRYRIVQTHFPQVPEHVQRQCRRPPMAYCLEIRRSVYQRGHLFFGVVYPVLISGHEGIFEKSDSTHKSSRQYSVARIFHFKLFEIPQFICDCYILILVRR